MRSHPVGIIASSPLTLRRLERVVSGAPRLVVAFAATSRQVEAQLASPASDERLEPPPLDVAVIAVDEIDPATLDRVEAWRELLAPRFGAVAITPACAVETTCRLARADVRHHLVLPVPDRVVAARLTACLPSMDDEERSVSAAAPPSPREQREVDLVLHTAQRLAPPRNAAMPSGFTARTLDVVLATLRAAGSATAAEVAAATGLSRVSARRYLDLMERRGEVTASCEYGRLGRPAIRYSAIDGEPPLAHAAARGDDAE